MSSPLPSKSHTLTQRPRAKLRLFFTGFTMGLADLVPGVSGGTIAFLFGVYDELLYSIKLITGRIPKLLLAGKFRQALKLTPFGFLLPLGLGILTAIFGLVQVVSYLLDTHAELIWALFFGLVLGSGFVISRRVNTWTLRRFALLGFGFLATFILVGLPALGGNDAPLVIFATGAVAITAMILPGISGSLIMVLLGQYEIIINAVAERDFATLLNFALGALVGLAVFVRLLSWLLKHYHLAVIAFLTGVIVGSLRRIWPWQTTDPIGNAVNVMPSLEWSLLPALLLMVLGLCIVVVLERVGVAREHVDIDTKDYKQQVKETVRR